MTVRARIEAITDQAGAALGRRIASDSEAVILAKQAVSAAEVALTKAQADKAAADAALVTALSNQTALYDELEAILDPQE